MEPADAFIVGLAVGVFAGIVGAGLAFSRFGRLTYLPEVERLAEENRRLKESDHLPGDEWKRGTIYDDGVS